MDFASVIEGGNSDADLTMGLNIVKEGVGLIV
jgi:hypothetical protein